MTEPKVLWGREICISEVSCPKCAWDDTKVVLMKLSCKVCHMMHSFIGKVCFHIDVPVVVNKLPNCQACSAGNQTDLGATYLPSIIPISVKNSNPPFKPLWFTAAGEGQSLQALLNGRKHYLPDCPVLLPKKIQGSYLHIEHLWSIYWGNQVKI